jgi:hypothetical protein
MPELHTKEIEPGRWIAATGASPYICVEAGTEAQALKTAQDGLAFYELHKHEIEPLS